MFHSEIESRFARQAILQDDDVSLLPFHGGKGCAELIGTSELDNLDSNSKGAAGILELLHNISREFRGRVEENCHATRRWQRLADEFEKLYVTLRGGGGQSSDVAAGPRQAGNETRHQRIGCRSHNDGNVGRCTPRRGDSRRE